MISNIIIVISPGMNVLYSPISICECSVTFVLCNVEMYYHRLIPHQNLHCLPVLVETVCSEVKYIQGVVSIIP